MYQQAAQEGNFCQEQKEDDQIKHCWGQMHLVEGKEQQSVQALPTTYFLIQRCLLYYHAIWCCQPCDLLVVPCFRTDVAMHLTHLPPLGGYLAAFNTLENLHEYFHLPRMEAEVWNFCQ